jgi:hypothetical protein
VHTVRVNIYTCLLPVSSPTYVSTLCHHTYVCLSVSTHTHVRTRSVNAYECTYFHCHHIYVCLLPVSSHSHVSVKTHLPTVSVNIHMCIFPESSHTYVPTLCYHIHMCVSLIDFTPGTSKRSRWCASVCCHLYWMINFLSWRYFRQANKERTCSNKSRELTKDENTGSKSEYVNCCRCLTSHTHWMFICYTYRCITVRLSHCRHYTRSYVF